MASKAEQLVSFSIEELKAELKRRDELQRLQEENERRKYSVLVLCPICKGSGQTENFDPRVGTNEMSQYSKCLTCNGSGRLTATRCS